MYLMSNTVCMFSIGTLNCITLYYTTFMHMYVAHAYIQVNTVHKLLYLKNETVLELTAHWKF